MLGDHLEALYVRDLALRVEDGDARALDAREARQGGLAGVSRGGRDDHDVTSVTLTCDGHEARQHLQGDVLEGAGWPMVKLEQPVIAEGESGVTVALSKLSAYAPATQAPTSPSLKSPRSVPRTRRAVA